MGTLPSYAESGEPGLISTMNTSVRVFVCDDRAEVREAVRQVIDDLDGFTWMGEAATGAHCLRALQAEPADLVILDVNIPGGGPSLAAALHEQYPATILVVFSAHSEPHVQEAMRRAGAHEFVAKTGRLALLRAALVRYAPARS